MNSPITNKPLPPLATQTLADVTVLPDWCDDDVASWAAHALRAHFRGDKLDYESPDEITIDYTCRTHGRDWDDSAIPAVLLIHVVKRHVLGDREGWLKLRLDRLKTVKLWLAQPDRAICVYSVQEVDRA